MGIFKEHKIALLIGVLILGIACYYVGGDSEEPHTASSNDINPHTAELITSLTTLQTIDLDEKLFADPAFNSLTDFGVIIPPQEVGRRNPFAPVGAGEARPPEEEEEQ